MENWARAKFESFFTHSSEESKHLELPQYPPVLFTGFPEEHRFDTSGEEVLHVSRFPKNEHTSALSTFVVSTNDRSNRLIFSRNGKILSFAVVRHGARRLILVSSLLPKLRSR